MKECVDGLYIKNGKVLLIKHAKALLKDCRGLVGGSVEARETLEQALKRQFKDKKPTWKLRSEDWLTRGLRTLLKGQRKSTLSK